MQSVFSNPKNKVTILFTNCLDRYILKVVNQLKFSKPNFYFSIKCDCYGIKLILINIKMF